MQRAGADAVSPVVGTVLMLAIVVAVIGIVFSVAVPQFREMEARSKARTAESMIQRLDAAIADLTVTSRSRSAQVQLDVPEGGLFVGENRTRWAIWSMAPPTTDERYDMTLLNFSDGDGVYEVRTEDTEGITPGVQIQINHTRWRGGRPTDIGVETGWEIPLPGNSSEVDIRPEDLAGGLHEIVFYNPTIGSEETLARAWVMDTASVRYEAGLYTGTYRYEALNAAVVADPPHADARLKGFDGIRVQEDAPASLSWTSVRLELGADGQPAAGAGPVTVPLQALPSQAIEDGIRGDPTVAFRGTHSELFREAAINETGMTFLSDPPRGRLSGDVDVTATDHLVIMPEGVVRG